TGRSDRAIYGKPSTALAASLADGRWVTQGDMLVDESQLVPGTGDRQTRIVAFDEVRLWPAGVVPFIVEEGVNRQRLQAAIRMLESETVVRFVEHAGEPDFVVFRAVDGEHCQSYLGRKGGEQEVLLAASCLTGQIAHELLHAL